MSLEEVLVTARKIEPNGLAAILAARPAGVLADRVPDVERVTRAPTVQPSQPAANKPPIPEVVVRAQRITNLFTRFSMFASMYYLMQNRPPDDMINEVIRQLQAEMDESLDISQAMNARTEAQRNPAVAPEEIPDVPEIIEIPIPQIEEVVVVAPRVTPANDGFIINFPPGMDPGTSPQRRPAWLPDLGPVVVPVPEPLDKPRDNPWEEVPREVPEYVPGNRPEVDPDIVPMPGRFPDEGLLPQVKLTIQPTFEGGLQFKAQQRTRSDRGRAENTLRKGKNERKSKKHSAAIRAVYRLVNKTWGEVSEVLDLWEVIENNLYIDGKKLADYEDKVAALKYAAETGNFEVDAEQLAYDYFLMEVMDRTIGFFGGLYGQTAAETGWYIPREVFRNFEDLED